MADKPSITQDPNQVAALIFIGGIVLGALFYFLYYSDLDAQLIKQRGVQNVQNKELSQLRKDQKNMQQTLIQVDCLRNKVAQTERQLPRSTQELDRFVNSLNSAAREHVIKISLIRRLEPEDSGLFQRVPFEIELYGNYDEIVEFFWEISEMDSRYGEQIVNVMSFAMEREFRDTAHPEKMIKVTTLIETYLYSAELLAEESEAAEPE